MKTKITLPAEVQDALRAAVAANGIRGARSAIHIAWSTGGYRAAGLGDHDGTLQRWRNSENGHAELAKVRMSDFKAPVEPAAPVCIAGIQGSSADRFDPVECGKPATHVTTLGNTLCKTHAKQKRYAKGNPQPIAAPAPRTQQNPEQEQQAGADVAPVKSAPYRCVVPGYEPPATARDWKGHDQTRPRPAKGQVIAHCNGVELIRQHGRKEMFATSYGLECKMDLEYGEAAREFGYAVMHATACEFPA